MAKPEEQSAEARAYDAAFYEAQASGSYRSGRLYAAHLWPLYQPNSVVDFGCGVGTWLKVFGELGAQRLKGFDGPWNRQENMIDPAIEFVGTDLNRAVGEGLGEESFDLAMSLEVAEHLDPQRSPEVVQALCKLAPVVMFGAAFLHQPGTRHINLRPHSFWGRLFAEQGYQAYDFFRPAFWGSPEVDYWYQQNTFLYVRRGHPLAADLAARGHSPVERLDFLDCVHPDLLEHYFDIAAKLVRMRKAEARAKGSQPADL